jgi:DHA3 family macrolide efflux protein-like MFS transporter
MFSDLMTSFGTYLTNFAMDLWVYQTTDSEAWYGVLLAASIFPAVIVAPLCGAIVDKYPRKPLLIVGYVGGAFCSASLFLLYFLNALTPWTVLCLVMVSSASLGLSDMVLDSSLRLFVSKRLLPRVMGIYDFGESVIIIFVPLVGILLYQWLSVVGVLAVDVITFILSMSIMLTLSFQLTSGSDDDEEEEEEEDLSIVEIMVSAWTFLNQKKKLLWLLLIESVNELSLGFFVVLFPAWILKSYSEGTYSFFLALTGLGFLVGHTLIIWKNPQKGHLRIILWGQVVLGILFLALSQAVSYLWLLALLVTLVTLIDSILDSCSEIVWQLEVPVRQQGRVFGLATPLGESMYPLGLLLSGVLFEYTIEPMFSNRDQSMSFVFVVLGCLSLVGPCVYKFFISKKLTLAGEQW